MEQRIGIERMEQAVNLFGSFDENIRLIEAEFRVAVVNREGELRVSGEPEDTMLAVKAINALLALSARGEPINEQNVRYVTGLCRRGQEQADKRCPENLSNHVFSVFIVLPTGEASAPAPPAGSCLFIGIRGGHGPQRRTSPLPLSLSPYLPGHSLGVRLGFFVRASFGKGMT